MSAPDRVRVAAHAKTNLLLRILAREHGGYHQIETVYALLEIADTLTVSRTAEGVTLTGADPDLGPVADNLAVRAADAVLAVTGRRFGVHIELTKQIPPRAGLGGGSSDAAATLHAVNALAGGVVPRHELAHLGARLGADVPFFVSGVPAALAWGRGERLFRLPPPPAYPALIAVPPVAIATPDAYGWWDAANPDPSPRGPVVLDADALATWGSVGRLGGNDFEPLVFARHGPVRELFERVASTGPLWVRLSGSGSAVAAVYRTTEDRNAAAGQLGTRGTRLIPTNSRGAPASAPTAL